MDRVNPDPHISVQWSNWAQVALAILASFLFFGNELRSWFTQDGLSISRVASLLFFKLFGSWPAKIEVVGEVEGNRFLNPDRTARGFNINARLRMKVRTPHPLVIRDLIYGLPDGSETQQVSYSLPQGENPPPQTHIDGLSDSGGGVPLQNRWIIESDKIRFWRDAGGRRCSSGVVKI